MTKYYGVYSPKGLGVFISLNKMETALSYLSGARSKAFASRNEAEAYARKNYNLLLEYNKELRGKFPDEIEMRINRTYYKNDLRRGRYNYEF